MLVTEADGDGKLGDLVVLAANEPLTALTGMDTEEVVGRRVCDLVVDAPSEPRLDVPPPLAGSGAAGLSLGALSWCCRQGGTLSATVHVLALSDGGERRRLLWFLEPSDQGEHDVLIDQADVVHRLGRGDPLPEVLGSLLHMVEGRIDGALASVLLLDDDGRLRHGAAPSLPHEYSAAIDGLAIGPAVGSCGTAAFSGEAVVTADIATDPRWNDYRHLALRLGLRSCWSLPIRSAADDAVLGTFALYYRSPRHPLPEEHRLLARCADLAAVAIQHHRLLRASHEQAALSTAVLDALDSQVALVDASGRVLTANAAWRSAGAETTAATLGLACSHEASGASHDAEVLVDTPAGPRWLEVRGTTLPTDAGLRVVAARDITARLEAEHALAHHRSHDPVTGLANRSFTIDRLDEALGQGAAAVLLLDLDGFTTVNNSLGHAAGDRLLCQAAGRIRDAVRPDDLVARVGGDEFAVVCPAIGSRHEATALVDRITAALAAPLVLNDTPVHVTASVGVALAARGHSGAEALRDASAAVRAAQLHGRGRLEVFTDELRGDARARLVLAGELRHAVERSQLRLVYQPVVRLPDGCSHGVEALLRWHHPQHGLLTPDRFLDIAESTGLIIDIGRWVLSEAVQQLATWDAQLGSDELLLKVNLSPRQLDDPQLPDFISTVLGDACVVPARVMLELTETGLMGDADDADVLLTKLKAVGVGLAIDDFGTGHSSLSRLQRFPIDTIKIDRSFVDGLGSDSEADAIVTAIIRLADALGIDTVAEGVETPAQRDRLHALGCLRAQGYLFSRPVAPDAITDWLTTVSAPDPSGGPPS